MPLSFASSMLLMVSVVMSVSFLLAMCPSAWGAGLRSAVAGVVAGAVPVDDDDRLIAHYPGVVAFGQRGDVARSRRNLCAVVHEDCERAAEVVLKVGRLAAVRPGDRLHVVRPAPAGLEDEAAHLSAADVEDLGFAV